VDRTRARRRVGADEYDVLVDHIELHLHEHIVDEHELLDEQFHLQHLHHLELDVDDLHSLDRLDGSYDRATDHRPIERFGQRV
jgi:hypothetical protein